MAHEQQPLDDPERIRAVTHPLRLQLLDLLAEHEELTATECAQYTGESVASCSFHLRMLEKYGFIERAEPRGREKPWKRIGSGGYSTTIDPDIPGSLQASTELARVHFQHRAQGLWDAIEHIGDEPLEWIEATRLMNGTIWATAEEAAALGDEIIALFGSFDDRDDAGRRPEGARRVRLLATVHVDPPHRAT